MNIHKNNYTYRIKIHLFFQAVKKLLRIKSSNTHILGFVKGMGKTLKSKFTDPSA